MKSLSRTRLFIICSFVLFFGLAILSKTALSQNKKPTIPPALVEVESVQQSEIKPNALYTGTVHFKDISEVASEVEGKVEKILFDEGFTVKKDEPLVILNSDILKKEIDIAKSQWETAKVELEKARTDFARIDKLYRKEGASKQLYDNFYYKIKIQEKKTEALRAAYEKLLVELHKKTIRAPCDAVVIKKMVDLGEWVGKGSVCATLGRLASTEVVVNIPSKYLKFNQVGEPVALSIPAVSEALISGKIYSVLPAGDVSSRTFPVKISIANDKARYLDGMEAKVYIAIGQPGKHLAVDRDALVLMQGSNFIFVVKNGSAQIVPVKIIAYTEKQVAIEAPGIKEGMSVVVRGNERLTPGQPVKIVKRH